MVKGKTRGDINVRNTAQVINGNISFVSRGIVPFEGEPITSTLDGKVWIKLSKLNGVSIFGDYIASWVVDYAEVVPLVFPETFTLTAPSGEKASYKFVELLP